MQPNPRILANLLILAETLANLLVETDQNQGIGGGAMGGALPPSTRSLSQTVLSPRGTKALGLPTEGDAAADGLLGYGETVVRLMRLVRPMETRREIKRLPLYDFRYSFRTFLGELDSRLSEFYCS